MKDKASTSSPSHSKNAVNNPIFQLLERPITEDYIKEWSNILMQKDQVSSVSKSSVVIFRLFQEWFALSVAAVKEITYSRPIHRIPHRSGKVLLGVANLNGELQSCISLNGLLEIGSSFNPYSPASYTRMIVLVQEKSLWIVPVDEIDGIQIWELSFLENVPVNISKSMHNYLKGIMKIDNRNIGLLDEELVFYSVKRSL
jgi:chemotaxis-related protein WspD